jgi:hypothetical protein
MSDVLNAAQRAYLAEREAEKQRMNAALEQLRQESADTTLVLTGAQLRERFEVIIRQYLGGEYVEKFRPAMDDLVSKYDDLKTAEQRLAMWQAIGRAFGLDE